MGNDSGRDLYAELGVGRGATDVFRDHLERKIRDHEDQAAKFETVLAFGKRLLEFIGDYEFDVEKIQQIAQEPPVVPPPWCERREPMPSRAWVHVLLFFIRHMAGGPSLMRVRSTSCS